LSSEQLESLLRLFRRQVRTIRVFRVLLLAGTAAAVLWATQLPSPDNKRAMFAIFIGTLVIWALIIINSARVARYVQTAGALLSIGQLDDAEVWLRRVLERFSLSARTKILACQQFASLFFRRDDHPSVVIICSELLKHRLTRLHSIWLNTRLMMADSLLMLDRVPEAYDAMRPVYDAPLSLSDRMKLLPIQLRYELAADHASASVEALPDKLRIAELLDSARAALVHALLAEACRRNNMAEQQAFLTERAWLYHDLDQLASRYPLIAPIAAARPAAAGASA
jgi:hypothetical protein